MKHAGWLLLCSGLWGSLAGCGGSSAGNRGQEYQLSREEQEVASLTNEARTQDSIAPLNVDLALCKIARAHADQMAKTGHPGIVDPKKLERDLLDAGYTFELWGFAGNKFAEGKLKNAFVGVLEGKASKAEVLNPEFRDMGVGISVNEAKEHFLLEVFAVRRKSK